MKINCKTTGPNCNELGILHDHELSIAYVPKADPAATIAPTNPLAAKSDVKMGRSFGCANSPTIAKAPTAMNGNPIPSTILPRMNIPTIMMGRAQVSFLLL